MMAMVDSGLSQARVAILGCGGLGSNVAAMLVRAGVGTLVLVDSDAVEASNLNRQMFFRDQLGESKTNALVETLVRIDEEAHLIPLHTHINAERLPDLVRGSDVIVEAVDDAATKALIVNTLMEVAPETPIVAASGLAGAGSANEIVTERMTDQLWVVGDLTSDIRDGLPLYSSRVMVAAAHQAHAVLRILLGFQEP